MTGQAIIFMGVSGCGKSSVGSAVAQQLNAKFIDGDDLQPRANIQKMASGEPLNDSDRMPWLERINDAAYSLSHKNERGIIVCSALKRQYRDYLRRGNPGIKFIYMQGEIGVILERLQQRTGHFMPIELLKSQFSTLEEPGSEEPDVLAVDIDASFEQVVDRCVQTIKRAGI